MKQALQINPADTVAVALQNLSCGTRIHIAGKELVLRSDVPSGHKFALQDISQGEDIIKYGYPIGHALHDISQGDFLDHHDLRTNLEGTLDYKGISLSKEEWLAPKLPDLPSTFMGYVRTDGQVGIRNELWVVPTVGCVNGICQQIVDRFKSSHAEFPAFAFPHNYGCSQLGNDHENTRLILRDMVHHPNAGGVLVVGLGCENNQIEEFRSLCGDFDPSRVLFLHCQSVEDEVTTGVAMLEDLYQRAMLDHREEVPVSHLRIGLKCGGSDGLSGITANPLLGAFSDWLCGQGGTTILTEVPEMFGAETILMQRCANQQLLDQTIRLINDFKEYYLSHGEPVGENPSPGNKAGGISTLEEKALGCTQKSGTSPVRGVLMYADTVQSSGLHLLSAPGNDLVATTALGAAGCQMVLFTTGRGTPFGSFIPTMKVSTNSRLYGLKPHWIDFDAGVLVEDTAMKDLLPRFVAAVLDVANGSQVRAEQQGIRDIAIFKQGVTL